MTKPKIVVKNAILYPYQDFFHRLEVLCEMRIAGHKPYKQCFQMKLAFPMSAAKWRKALLYAADSCQAKYMGKPK